MIETWQAAWPKALEAWSEFVKLRDPLLCEKSVQAHKEGLTGSFAMIRLTDQQVVINLREVERYRLQDYALEILAHEVGHHVYCPANLTDQAKLLRRMRKALPLHEDKAPLVANLYADILLNDRLQRHVGLRMNKVYEALPKSAEPSDFWQLYLRVYEILWGLESQTLTSGAVKPNVELDAKLAARLVRVYSQDWLKGAGGFAALLYPYFANPQIDTSAFNPFFDMESAGAGDGLPDLSGDDEGECQHPLLDPKVTSQSKAGKGDDAGEAAARSAGATSDGAGAEKSDNEPIDIAEYGEILKAMGSRLSARELVVAYYRMLSSGHLMPYPMKKSNQSKELQAEGLETWEIGASMEDIDWFQTAARSPVVIPGVTIVERHYEEVSGPDPAQKPFDLYIGIDCSGSMGDPARQLSYQILSAAIISRSALKAGARVRACLSGESGGKTVAMDEYSRNEKEILTFLTSYLGTGYAFGIHYLSDHILETPPLSPVHLLIVSDQDIFTILAETDAKGRGLGWDVAERALHAAGGGGTMVLSGVTDAHYAEQIKRLKAQGWNLFYIASAQDMVHFAKTFSKRTYSQLENFARRQR